MVATILFFVLLVAAVLILALLLALYLVPVTVSAIADCSRERARATATVAWGIVGARVQVTDEVQVLEILLAERRIMARDIGEMMAERPEEREVEERRPARPVREYLDAAGDLWPHIRRILKTVYRSLHLESLRADIVLGLESPADTGVVYGYCTAARYALWPVEAVDFVVTPVFDREVFEGTFLLRMQIRRPLLILIAVAQALLNRPVRERLRQVSGGGVPGA
jgi:hypothetical protein